MQTTPSAPLFNHWLRLATLAHAVALVGCATPLPPEPPYSVQDLESLLIHDRLPTAAKPRPAPFDLPPVPTARTPITPVLKPALSMAGQAQLTPKRVSQAGNPKEYRRDGAQHIYQLNSHRIYPGPMPALMQAVGVLEVEIDAVGQIKKLHWMRAPDHVPEVMQEIERTVLAAAPFPAAVRLGDVKYTDVWLWDKSGRFQLDTLTEGQLRR